MVDKSEHTLRVEAMLEAAAAAPRRHTKTLRLDYDRRLMNAVGHSSGIPFSEEALQHCDRSKFPALIAELREKEAQARQLRRRLETVLAAEEGGAAVAVCAGCDAPMVGRADRQYCSAVCRQRAYRRRNRSPRLVAWDERRRRTRAWDAAFLAARR